MVRAEGRVGWSKQEDAKASPSLRLERDQHCPHLMEQATVSKEECCRSLAPNGLLGDTERHFFKWVGLSFLICEMGRPSQPTSQMP